MTRAPLARSIATAALLAACRPEHTPPPSLDVATASAVVAASARPPAAVADAGAHENAVDDDEEILRHAAIVALTPHAGDGAFEAILATKDGPRPALVEPAHTLAPMAYRAPLAYYALSRALGMDVVPITVVRPATLRELGPLLDRGAGTAVLRQLSVQNDGTIDVLLATRASRSASSPWDTPRGVPFDVRASRDITTWDRWASSPEPVAGEDRALLRDYVEMLVLDYLSANVARLLALRSGSALVLADNATAFPPHADRSTLNRMLRRLRAVARFPRDLPSALAKLDRARAAAVLAPGGFDTWTLSPRALVELDERRAALITLIEARIEARGREAVLAL